MLVDALEVFNSVAWAKKIMTELWIWQEKIQLGQTAESDAHPGREIGNAGIITDAQDLRTAIENSDMEFFGQRSSLLNKHFMINHPKL